MTKNIAVVSLGCDKNRVDTENMLYNLSSGKFNIVQDYSRAEIIIVNTCAFIESARAEAIDTILQMAQYKQNLCKKLIVTGCLVQKYLNDIKDELVEVDAFLGTNAYQSIIDTIEKLYKNERVATIDRIDNPENSKRILTTPYHYAYLKVAEGCDNKCTFCTIPSIRGKYVSKSMQSLVLEAEGLANNGVKEIILVAQDVTRYGMDLYKKPMLIPLIKELSRLDFTWIRLMYCYPELVSDELIAEILQNDKVAKYIDIPFQHTDEKILRLMGRRDSPKLQASLINKLKKAGIAIRSTFMVGFPSETDEQFDNLYKFLQEYKLENVGIFAYSAEEDTPSYKIKGHISEEEKLKRVDKIGELFLKNCIQKNKSMIGKTVKVLYEDIDYDRNLFVGRTQYNAPQIDSVVYFSGEFVEVGEFYDVLITGYDDYDLIGEIIKL